MSLDGPSEGLPTAENHTHSRADSSRRQVTIDILSDDALLYVFDFYVAQAWKVEAWHTLVHVCRRWRILVFGSPRRLNLRIECTCVIPFREKLDIWPALPIIILGNFDLRRFSHDKNHIKALLKHHDRVCRIELQMHSSEDVREIFAALEKPFPVLTDLQLSSWDPLFPDPDRFLGGSTHLRSFSLSGISIPDLLPKLLLSSTDLVDLRLGEYPTPGFASPDEMVTALSAMTRLQVLHLNLEHSEWEIRRLHPPTRTTVLPFLIELKITGLHDIEHLDDLNDLMARIDAPLLNHFNIILFFDHDRLDAPEILRFIAHVPKFQAFDEAHMEIDDRNARIKFLSTKTTSTVLKLRIICGRPELLLAQFCRPPFFPLSTLESLYIDKCWNIMSRYQGDAGWLDLLRPFTSVKNLYLCDFYALKITSALVTGESVTEVLPALESLFLEELPLPSSFQPTEWVPEATGEFIAAQALSGHPLAVSLWDRSQNEEEEND